jgi:riboflavin synthase
MFTGIIETMGEIKELSSEGTNQVYWVSSSISDYLKIDQSVAHDGVCLTVDKLAAGMHRVTAIGETLKKTNLTGWRSGEMINLERCLPINGRLDGHLVQGHVDAKAVCTGKKVLDGSWELQFEFPKKFNLLIVEKGSICVNGISLTAFAVNKKSFRVAIIPYTFEHTNIGRVEKGSSVNIEFDLIGKYVSKWKNSYERR